MVSEWGGRGGRPRMARYVATITVVVEVGAPDVDTAADRLLDATARAAAAVGRRQPGHPAVVAAHVTAGQAVSPALGTLRATTQR